MPKGHRPPGAEGRGGARHAPCWTAGPACQPTAAGEPVCPATFPIHPQRLCCWGPAPQPASAAPGSAALPASPVLPSVFDLYNHWQQHHEKEHLSALSVRRQPGWRLPRTCTPLSPLQRECNPRFRWRWLARKNTAARGACVRTPRACSTSPSANPTCGAAKSTAAANQPRSERCRQFGFQLQ